MATVDELKAIAKELRQEIDTRKQEDSARLQSLQTTLQGMNDTQTSIEQRLQALEQTSTEAAQAVKGFDLSDAVSRMVQNFKAGKKGEFVNIPLQAVTGTLLGTQGVANSGVENIRPVAGVNLPHFAGIKECTYRNSIARLFDTAVVPGQTAITHLRDTSNDLFEAAQFTPETKEKHQAGIEFEQVVTPFATLATHQPVSEQMIECLPQMVQKVQGMLANRWWARLDRDLLDGTQEQATTGNGVLGLRAVAGEAQAATGVLDGVKKAVLGVMSKYRTPTGIVIDPALYFDLLISTEYNLFGNAPDSMLGFLDLSISPLLYGTGEIIAGDFTTATLYRANDGLNFDISNSHANFFIRNMISIRAEQRVAATYDCVNAFTRVTVTA